MGSEQGTTVEFKLGELPRDRWVFTTARPADPAMAIQVAQQQFVHEVLGAIQEATVVCPKDTP